MAAKLPTDADRAEAISRLLSGLARGDDARALAAAIETDGFWWYAMIAAVAIIRACADRKGLAVPDYVRQLGNR